MPQLPVVVDMTPVDYVSRAILALADQRPAPGTVFHLLNPDPPALNTVGAWIRAYGYRLEAVPYHAWHDQLLSTAASRPESLAATVLPFLSPEEAEFQMDQRGFNATRSQQALAGVVLPPTTLEAESIERTLTYFISTGFLPAPGEKEYERSHH